jgi:putative acetyltransferase
MLYVDPGAGRQGVGAALVDALTRLAKARDAKRLTAEASDVSKPLFERLGFSAESRSLVQLDDQWLAHTTMTKTLGDSTPATRH